MGSQPACAWGDVAAGLNPSPPHYRMAFASSRVPCPHPYRLTLRLAFPKGGIRVSHVPHEYPWMREAPPVRRWRHICGRRYGSASTWPHTFLVQASQPLWLVGSHDVYRRFTSVSHVIPPWLPTALRLAVVCELSRVAHHLVGEATLSQELHTVGLPRPHVLVGY